MTIGSGKGPWEDRPCTPDTVRAVSGRDTRLGRMRGESQTFGTLRETLDTVADDSLGHGRILKNIEKHLMPLLVTRMLLVAPGIATSSKKLLVARSY